MQQNKLESTPFRTVLIVLAFFSIYVFWGSTYFMNKMALKELAPLMLASVRFITAGILIFLIAKSLGFNLSITKKQLLNSTLAGFLFLSYGNGVFVWSLKFVDSGFAALEASTQPLIILLLMRVFQGKKISSKSIIGVMLGILGIYLLVSQKQLIQEEGSALAIALIFSCILSWSIASLFVTKADLPRNFFVSAGYQMFCGGVLLAIASLVFDEKWLSPVEWGLETYLSLTGLVMFGSIAAFTSFNYLLKVVPTEKVATSTLVNPIVALFLGWYFLDEQITQQSMIAAAVLLTGVYFINNNKRKIEGKPNSQDKEV